MSIDENYELIELKKILTLGEISTVFQPIVSLKDGHIIGYEALSRGPINSILHCPDKLFSAAEKFKMTWDIELLCRTKAIERGSSIDNDKLLFINVDPHILKDDKFKKGFTKEFLFKHNISPEKIIFEITEKTCIKDFTSFKNILNNYMEQGYKIAIDDTGAGYSGLKMLTETKPTFVKIDMDIIKNIDKDSFKQALIKALVDLSEITHMNLIAEGIETEEELLTLLNLGVYAGQGFFLQKPAGSFLDIQNSVKQIILKHNRLTQNNFSSTINNCIGTIASYEQVFSINTSCKKVKDYLEKSDVSGACIVESNLPAGLIMEHSLDSVLATQYGVAVFSKRPVSLVMDTHPLVVDYYTPISEVSKVAMNRTNNKVYDIVIVTREDNYYGIVTIKKLLQYATKLEFDYAKASNPLTGLPGNTIIQSKLKKILNYQNNCCLLYYDLNNFKSYNDTYGFENGDLILKFTSDIISNRINEKFPYNSFIGHIGGDDFLCIIESTYEKCEEVCHIIISDFNAGIVNFYTENDKEKGYIECINRDNKLEKFPLTSIAIAGLYGNFKIYNCIETLAYEASIIKKQVKKSKTSHCYIKRLQ